MTDTRTAGAINRLTAAALALAQATHEARSDHRGPASSSRQRVAEDFEHWMAYIREGDYAR